MIPGRPTSVWSPIHSATFASHGHRSSSSSWCPDAILATLAAGCRSSPSSKSHPRRPASSPATVDFPQPETPINTNTGGCPGDALTIDVSDLRVTGVSDRVHGEADQPDGDDAQQDRSIGVVQQLGQGAVEADCAARVIVDRGFDEAVADEAENNHSCEVPEDSDRGEPALDRAAHLPGL